MHKWIREHGWIRSPKPIEPWRPSGWVGTDTVLGWIAFGNALDLDWWDLYFFVGASKWRRWPPASLARRLEQAERGEVLTPSEIGDRLLGFIEAEADEQINRAIHIAELCGDVEVSRQLRRIPSPPAPEHLGATAGLLAAHIEANLLDFERKHAAILDAAYALRRALARGDLAVLGGAGDGPVLASSPAPPQKPVPRAVFQAPVTLTCDGVLPWECAADCGARKRPRARLLYPDLAFDADKVLQVWPSGRPSM